MRLRDKINEALTQLQNDGTLANLQVQYLGVKPEDVSPPQPTPPPVTCLDSAQWVADLSYDDKKMKSPPVMNPGQPFTKGWRMRNNGTCSWIRRRIGRPGYSSLAGYAKRRVKRALEFAFDFEDSVIHHVRDRGLDGVICGHIHWAEINEIGGLTYVNCGDWVDSCTAIVEHHAGRLELVDWDGEIVELPLELSRSKLAEHEWTAA